MQRRCRLFGIDGQGWLQIIGGLVIGLIALYSSYDHIAIGTARYKLNQQRGVWFILASLAVVAVDAQLASQSRGREEDRRRQETRARIREANEADRERNRAAQARKRQAEGAERQRQGIALLRGAALLSARVQLEPSELNRTRLSAFLSLLAEQAFLDQQGPEP